MIRNGTLVLFKTTSKSRARLGRVCDFQVFDYGIRYKIERRITGKFLDNIQGYINGTANYVSDTRWCFFMWMKPDRIVKILINE